MTEYQRSIIRESLKAAHSYIFWDLPETGDIEIFQKNILTSIQQALNILDQI